MSNGYSFKMENICILVESVFFNEGKGIEYFYMV